jgi:hypothetical protein
MFDVLSSGAALGWLPIGEMSILEQSLLNATRYSLCNE